MWSVIDWQVATTRAPGTVRKWKTSRACSIVVKPIWRGFRTMSRGVRLRQYSRWMAFRRSLMRGPAFGTMSQRPAKRSNELSP